jgi:hypothetical protein
MLPLYFTMLHLSLAEALMPVRDKVGGWATQGAGLGYPTASRVPNRGGMMEVEAALLRWKRL